MKQFTTRLCIYVLLASCIVGRTADRRAEGADAAGSWVGYGNNGGFFRLELYRDGTGYFATEFEHTRSKAKPDVYRVLNWKATKGFRTAEISFWHLDIKIAPIDTNAVPIKFRRVEFYGGKDAESMSGGWIDIFDMFHGGSDSADNAEWKYSFRLYNERGLKTDAERTEKAVERERRKAK